MPIVNVAGLDGSMTHFGAARMQFDTDSASFIGDPELMLVVTEKSKNKQVRVSSDNLSRGQTIHQRVTEFLREVRIVFAEVPHGGAKSAKALFSFGLVTGIYAAIPNLVEVSPGETKMNAVGSKHATKDEMIAWATARFPNAAWRRYKRNGVLELTADNEHIADAVGVIYAGIRTPMFQQALTMMRSVA